jgi:hypothetical protein
MNKIKMLTNLLALLIVCSSCSKIEPKVLKLTGSVFGTSFHITYLSHNLIDYSSSIDSILEGLISRFPHMIRTPIFLGLIEVKRV